MIKFPGKRVAETDQLSVLVPAPTTTSGWRNAAREAEPLAACETDLRSLSEPERVALLNALRAVDVSDLLRARLPNMNYVQRGYQADTEAVFIFESSLITVAVDPLAPSHVHQRIADLAPFLNVAAAVLTHSGALPACLLDDGVPGHLSFCGRGETLLLPDVYFWSSEGYRAARADYRSSPRWEERLGSVLWRGSTTGYTAGEWTELPRVKLCVIARNAAPDLNFDVGFTSVVQLSKAAESEIFQADLMRPWVSPSDYGLYRYHVDIDGNTNSWSGLFCKLLSGGLVFKVDPPKQDQQWYYARLQPWKHYVPVESSLDDLEDKIRWARAHDHRAAQIAASGRRLAESLTLLSEADFARAVIETGLAKANRPSEGCKA